MVKGKQNCFEEVRFKAFSYVVQQDKRYKNQFTYYYIVQVQKTIGGFGSRLLLSVSSNPVAGPYTLVSPFLVKFSLCAYPANLHLL